MLDSLKRVFNAFRRNFRWVPLKKRTVEENRGFSSLLETSLQTELTVVISRLL